MMTGWQAKLTALINNKNLLFIYATIRNSNQVAACQNNGLFNPRCAVDLADNHQNFLNVSAEKNKIMSFASPSLLPDETPTQRGLTRHNQDFISCAFLVIQPEF